jgi:hypothetical protein
MRNRSPGESLPRRRLIRLQRARRCRRRPCPDIERRTLKCTPLARRPALGVPARFFAAAHVPWASTCRRCLPSRIHRHRNPSVVASITSSTPPPDVITATNLLQCGLPSKLPNRRTQAQPSGACNATRPTFFRTAFEPVRASNRRRLTCSFRATGLLPPSISTSTRPATTAYFASNPSPSSPQHASQQETADGRPFVFSHPSPWTSQRGRRTGHACPRTKASRPEAQVHARRRPATRRLEREEELDLEADCRLFPRPQFRYFAGALLHETQS